MAEPAEEGDASVDVEGVAAQWVIERAHELDREPEAFLEDLLVTVRSATNGTEVSTPASEASVSAVDDRVTDLESEVEELIADVRERVIQVKRETDEKAPSDHEHEDLAETIAGTRADVAELEDAVAAIESTMDQGFDNFEEILEYLVEETDALAERIDTLGSALLDLRSTTRAVAAREQGRARADRLRKKALERGVRQAKCESCGTKIDLALLPTASCPTCEVSFRDLAANPGFFRTSTLLAGDQPALEAPPDEPVADSLESAFDVEGTTERRHPDWFGTEEGATGNSTEEASDDER